MKIGRFLQPQHSSILNSSKHGIFNEYIYF
jgi:hypothetical protein